MRIGTPLFCACFNWGRSIFTPDSIKKDTIKSIRFACAILISSCQNKYFSFFSPVTTASEAISSITSNSFTSIFIFLSAFPRVFVFLYQQFYHVYSGSSSFSTLLFPPLNVTLFITTPKTNEKGFSYDPYYHP